MRVAFLVQHLWPETTGGVELQMESVSRYLRRWGHDVRLWASDLPAGSCRRLADGRIVRGIGGAAAPGSLWRAGPLWKVVQTAIRLPSPRRTEVIFSPDPLLATAVLLNVGGAALIYCPGGTVRGSLRWLFADARPQDGILGGLLRARPSAQYLLAERLCLLRAPMVIGVSQSVARQMKQVHPGCAGRIRVIYNGFEPADFSPGPEGPPPALTARQPSEPFTVITVARLHRIKNIPHLLRASE